MARCCCTVNLPPCGGVLAQRIDQCLHLLARHDAVLSFGGRDSIRFTCRYSICQILASQVFAVR